MAWMLSFARRADPKTLWASVRSQLAAPDDAAFRKRFAGGPIKRIGFERFRRNVMIAIGNSEKRNLIDATAAALDSDSPAVRGAAVWALGRLLPNDQLDRLAAQYRHAERDSQVAEEWTVRASGVRCRDDDA